MWSLFRTLAAKGSSHLHYYMLVHSSEIRYAHYTKHTQTTILRLCGFCPGQPRWAGTRINIHPLTPIVVFSCHITQKYKLHKKQNYSETMKQEISNSRCRIKLCQWINIRNVNQYLKNRLFSICKNRFSFLKVQCVRLHSFTQKTGEIWP